MTPPLMFNVVLALITISLIIKYIEKKSKNTTETSIQPSTKNYDVSFLKKIEKIVKKPFPEELRPLFEESTEPPGRLIKDETSEYVYHINEWESLATALSSLTSIEEEVLEKSYIPIAVDTGGNMFIYSVEDRDYGYIYYIDFEYFEEDSTRFKVLLAKSYSEFVSKLYSEEPEEDPDDWRAQLIKKLDLEIENNKK